MGGRPSLYRLLLGLCCKGCLSYDSPVGGVSRRVRCLDMSRNVVDCELCDGVLLSAAQP